MNDALLAALQAQFPTLDVTQLPSPNQYNTLFALYGLSPLTLSGGQWTQAADGTLSITTQISSPLLGLTSPSATIQFLTDGPADDPSPLILTLTLPQGWSFGITFPSLAIGLLGTAVVQPGGTMTLSSSTVGNYTQNLWVSVSATTQETILTLIAKEMQLPNGALVLSGSLTPQNPGILNACINAQLAIAGASTSVTLFGTDITLAAYVVSSPDVVGMFHSGLQLQAQGIQYNGQPITITGTVETGNTTVIDCSIKNLDFPDSNTLDSLFGGSDFLGAVNTVAQELSNVTVANLTVSISFSPVAISSIGVSLVDTVDTFDLFAGLSVTDLGLTVWIGDPFTAANRSWFVRLDGTLQASSSSFGGMQINVYGEVPAELFGGELAAPTTLPIGQILSNLGISSAPQLPACTIDTLEFEAALSLQVYTLSLALTDVWSFTTGSGTTVDVEECSVLVNYAAGASNPLTLDVSGTVRIGPALFLVSLQDQNGDWMLRGEWSEGSGVTISYLDIVIALGIYGLPSLPADIDVTLVSGGFLLNLTTMVFTFYMATQSGTKALLVAGETATGWGFLYGGVIGETIDVSLSDIPILSSFVTPGDDVLSIRALRMEGGSATLPAYDPTIVTPILGSQINSGLAASADLAFGSTTVTVTAQFGGYDNQSNLDVPPSGTGAISSAPPALMAEAATTSATNAPSITWTNVQRNFGPLQIGKVGYTLSGGSAATLLLDGGLSVAGFDLSLIGLGVTVPLSTSPSLTFSLQGFGLSYTSPSLSIAGSLMATQAQGTLYSGSLSVQTSSFGFSVLGAYETGTGSPSLFAYADIQAPLGGPPFFFVTGLAGGFGYNFALPAVTVSQVASFPLVQAALGQTVSQADVQAMLVPAPNDNWAAVGVEFTSFEVIESFALLTVTWGTSFQLGLLGLSTLTVPSPADDSGANPVAQVQMAVDVSLQPSAGQLAVNAALTPASYVLSQSAQLTGGFAFYAWFGSSPYAGDFVVTLGGYCSYFTPPMYYPQVAPVGLNWTVSPGMQLKGSLYFALTPAVIMAGGQLQALWQSSTAVVSFNAQVDFLMRFQPFFYALDISVSVSITLSLDLLVTTSTLHFQLGVGLSLWGPAFGGTAAIDLSVATFTVSFGSSQSTASTSSLDWAGFRTASLPPESTAPTARLGDDPSPTATASLITCNATTGLVTAATPGQAITVIAAATLTFSLQIPSTSLIIDGASIDLTAFNTTFGAGPMGVAPGGLQVATVITTSGGPAQPWTCQLTPANLPASLWGNTSATAQSPSLVSNVVTTVALSAAATLPPDTLSVDASLLAESSGGPPLSTPWSAVVAPSSDTFDQATAMAQLTAGIASATTVSTRGSILASLAAQGLTTSSSVDLTSFATAAPFMLIEAPVLRYLGETV